MTETHWFAINAKRDFKAESLLVDECEEVFFPKEQVSAHAGCASRQRAVIPHVMFIKTTFETALELEKRSREVGGRLVPFWIYRYPTEDLIRPIPELDIRLLKLLTAEDATRCEVFRKGDFKRGQRVRVKDGLYKGMEGYVQRVKKNRHVLVQIEGICVIMLPFIHPDLLEPVPQQG